VNFDGLLTTAAEISIAIADFSGIVVALAPGRLAELPTAAKPILSALLVVTASTFAFAFAPYSFFPQMFKRRPPGWFPAFFMRSI
jgi:hypothetical protein